MDCNRVFVKDLTVKKLSLIAQEDDAGRRLDRILRKALPDYPLSAIHRILRKGRVLVNGKPGRGEDRISAGALIELTDKESKDTAGVNKGRADFLQQKNISKINIIWNEDGLLILNKPAGLSVHGGSGQEDNLDMRVKEYCKRKLPPSLSFRPGPLHRLDKASSGIVVFALNLEAAKRFSALIKERKIRKQYLAVLEGELKQSESWKETLVRDQKAQKTFVACGSGRNQKEALTFITPLARANYNGTAYTYARLEIKTGRTHQIRAQAAYHGHPLAGDRKYGGHPLPRPYTGFFLHARELEFPLEPNAESEIPLVIRAPLPKAFAEIVNKLFDNFEKRIQPVKKKSG